MVLKLPYNRPPAKCFLDSPYELPELWVNLVPRYRIPGHTYQETQSDGQKGTLDIARSLFAIERHPSDRD